jgi:hypothetical protein
MNFENAYKGKYKLRNPQKYIGDKDNVVYRSLWERKLCTYFDNNSSVLEWGIEPFSIPYFNPLDKKSHNYWIDFWIKVKEKDGKICEKLIEVKPYKLTQAPVLKEGKAKRKYLKEMEIWVKNNSKWKAAKALCEQKNWEFVIITEKNLFKNG